ncbi:MAG: hypothetical protein OER86_05420 [Phycisphaerae bacterium]|nr:hypothetical protein [Phycisphaerae bacterium]
MPNLSQQAVLKALKATGERFGDRPDAGPIRIVVCGAVAGILSEELSGQRQTLDCDVIVSDPEERFAALAEAAAEVGRHLSLKPDWLNQDAGMYAHLLPLGWKQRLRSIDRFGLLQVMIIGRIDLLALKLIGSAKRPQDLDDIDEMEPTREELNFMAEYLDRKEAESLDHESFEHQRSVLEDLKASR